LAGQFAGAHPLLIGTVGLVDQRVHPEVEAGFDGIEEVGDGAEGEEFLAAIGSQFEGVLTEASRIDQLTEGHGETASVEWNEDVRRDAPSPVDGPARLGAVGEGIHAEDTVGLDVFTALLPGNPLVLVVDAIAVGTLDAAATRCVVPCDGQPQGATIGHGKLFLHEALAEGPPADDDRPVVVLEGAGKDFTGRGTALIDHHHERKVPEQPRTFRHVFAAGLGGSFGVDHEVPLIEEPFHHGHGRMEVSAPIAPQVEHEPLDARLEEAGQGGVELLVGVAGEPDDLDVACAIRHALGRHHAVDGNAPAPQGHVEEGGVRRARPKEAEANLGARRSLEQAHHLRVAQSRTCDDAVVHRDDAVSGPDAGGLAGSAHDGRDHHDGVLLEQEFDPDALEVALHRLGHGRQLLGAEPIAVRVQLIEDGVDGDVGQAVPVHRVHVHAVDAVEDRAEDLAGRQEAGLGKLPRGGAGAESAAEVSTQAECGAQSKGHPSTRHGRAISRHLRDNVQSPPPPGSGNRSRNRPCRDACRRPDGCRPGGSAWHSPGKETG